MSVNDHGIEALKKAAEVDSSPTEYRFKTRVVESAPVDVAYLPKVVDATLSTATPLGAGAVFGPTAWVDVLRYPMVSFLVAADAPAATRGFHVEWSADGVNAHADDEFDHAGVHGDQWNFGPMARYVRVTYTNGATPQSSFTIQTILHRATFKHSSHRLDDAVDADDDATLCKAVITGQTPDGGYLNARLDPEGNILMANRTAFDSYSIFGDVFTTIAETRTIHRTAYTEQTVNAQRSIGSGNAADAAAGTGARKIRVTYLDEDGAGPYTEDVTLNGVTPVDTVAVNICFIEKLEVVEIGSGGANAGIITLYAGTAGAGATIGTIGATDNQTFWAHHYVPVGKTARVTGMAGHNDNSSAANGTHFRLFAKPIDGATAVLRQVSDPLWVQGQSPTTSRMFTSHVKVVGPARITGYMTSNSGANRTNYFAFDYYETTT